VAADVGQEELETVGCARDGSRLVLLLRSLFLLGIELGLRDLDVVRLELTLKQLGVLFADVVLEHERLELGCLELAAVLLRTLDERLYVLGFKEFDELVLRQRPVQSFRVVHVCNKRTKLMTAFCRIPG
jgi:hypothetical protein